MVGFTPADMKLLRKMVIRLSMILRTGIDYFYSLSIPELLDLIEEVAEVNHERKRA